MTELEETWSPEPVKAWRYWRVSPLEWDFGEHRWQVQLIGDVEAWDSPVKFAGQHNAVEARIEHGVIVYHEVNHRSPQQGCMCGINAVKVPDWNELQSRSSNHVCSPKEQGVCREEPVAVAVAPVELAGIVDEYDEGYRAEQATIVGPVHLFNGSVALARAVSSVYGVEVIAEDWAGQWVAGLYIEAQRKKVESGHRQADSSDNRGTGTGQATRTGKRTREGWRKVRLSALGVLLAIAILFVLAVGGHNVLVATRLNGEPIGLGGRFLGVWNLVWGSYSMVRAWGWFSRTWQRREAR